MPTSDLSLIAHLMRRAGFGATRDELEAHAAKGYDALVEDLLYPERFPEVADDDLRRYYLELNDADSMLPFNARWIYRMVNTRRPLEEKMALFWHHLFATSVGKSEHGPSSIAQLDTFRRNGLSDLRTILLDLARDPAMIHFLDNSENHKDEPNENWGRELLELFSMGVGNYTELDIKVAASAFTGWTFTQPIPLDPYGRYDAEFVYRADDHDDGVKTFLGETGRLDGEDIVDIIVKQPATARFIARHLYNFFVTDEPQVPAWNETPPLDPAAIATLTEAYNDSGGELRPVMRALFHSDFFKQSKSKKVKSPAELVAGIVKLAGTYRSPDPGLADFSDATTVMGQVLMTPPTVEGWHTGKEWIDLGNLGERVNFAVDQLGDDTKPGVQAIIERLTAIGASLPPEQFVDQCLELVGPITVGDETRAALMEYALSGGALRWETEQEREESAARVSRMLQLIVSTVDYQFA